MSNAEVDRSRSRSSRDPAAQAAVSDRRSGNAVLTPRMDVMEVSPNDIPIPRMATRRRWNQDRVT